ncbi:Site-specific recombinase XerD [Natronorubrum sediminis]|uniref:Site-specific recombinase XerD n=1 Tax=Natronorubrum sediminis TaxID=640943 RepID=A0A1H6FK08_9EURY|nr:site-specific integrase [Natronorubrum sediminis]SEH11197.1 Site-specific recombinase XerD [Natronorubrum sediminis]
MDKPEKVEGIVLIPGPSRDILNERQLVAYESYRRRLIKWLARQGKNPDALEGYAHDTARNYASIIDKFHRQVWQQDGYTLDLGHETAEDYLRSLIMSDDGYSRSHLHNVKLALIAYFRFNGDEWEPDITIKSSSGVSQPRDFLSGEERTALREAALEYGTVPAYAALDPDERTEWKRFLARRYGKSVSKVSKEDWDRANGFKYPSIIHTALDAGLRPIEVGRARTYWVDVENSTLRIPEEESSKNNDNWTVSLRRETTEYLARWLEEREMYDKYDDTDRLWLTRHSNPYSGSSLRYVLDATCNIAGIDRDISWYAIRHWTGTYMAREEGLAAAQSQLRHKSIETTAKYDQAPVDDRRDALDRMG